MIHLALCLQESISNSGSSSSVNLKALNAVYLSRVFLKFLVEHSKNEMIEELYLSLDENEAIPNKLSGGMLFFSSNDNGHTSSRWELVSICQMGLRKLGFNHHIHSFEPRLLEWKCSYARHTRLV